VTAVEIIRRILDQHIVDIDRRGHVPACYGGMWTSHGPRECTELCQEARRIADQGEVRQEVLL